MTKDEELQKLYDDMCAKFKEIDDHWLRTKIRGYVLRRLILINKLSLCMWVLILVAWIIQWYCDLPNWVYWLIWFTMVLGHIIDHTARYIRKKIFGA